MSTPSSSFRAGDPFAALGLSRRATLVEARAAYRRLALAHHPDRNPGDLEAADRFKRVLAAYRRVHASLRGAPLPSAPKAGPRPDRFACGSCGDCFPFPEACPRCGVPLWDRDAGPAVAPERPEVEAMIAALSARPAPVDDGNTPHVPAVLVLACSAAALLVWQVGPVGPALLFAGFAAYVALVEAHRRATMPAGA
ncbi:MAG: J domain-containing protein [Sandaracinaceae bacterium]|nr:J domain-containing protein [Sandaracinaceae bacterium]